jgi:hypothetical protein
MDWNKGLREKRAVVNRNMDLRNQRLQQQIDAANAKPPPNAIIGGQLVPGGDAAAYNAANAQRNAVAADANARMSLRGKFGSRNVTSMRGQSGSAGGGDPVELGQDMAQPQQLQEIQPDGSQLPNAGEAGAPANMGDPSMGMQATPQNFSLRAGSQPFRNTMSELASDFPEGKPSSVGDALNSGRASFDSTDNPTRSGYGFRNGGSVMDKPRMVKQPGYKSGGKVKMPGYEMGGQIGPEVTKWAGEKKKRKGMRGYAVGGKIGKKSEDDGKDTVDVRVREGEYMLNPETVGFMGGGSYEQGVRALDDIVRQATGEEPGPVPVNDEGEAMRGFAKGGKMGYNQSGATIRPGAQAVAEEARRLAQAEARALENIRRSEFEPRPRPNANVGPQQPLRSGAQPARPTTASFGSAPKTVINDVRTPDELRQAKAAAKATTTAARQTAPQGFRSTINNGGGWNPEVNTESVKRAVGKTGRAAWTGSKVLGRGLAKTAPVVSIAGDAYGIGAVAADPESDWYDVADQTVSALTASAAGGLGAIGGGAVGGLPGAAVGGGGMYAGTKYGLDNIREATTGDRRTPYERTVARREADAALEAADADLAAQDKLIEASGYTREQFARGEVPAEVENSIAEAMGAEKQTTQERAAAAAARAASGEYYRPFGGGEVNLRGMPEAAASQAVGPGGMNIVQRTGGPNNEVIVREDVDGVPTFSNLRTAPQAGDAATLQAQADARAREDVGIREMQNRAVEQMRQNAPVYGNTEAEQLRDAETKARQARALAAAENNPNMSLDDLQGEFEALGMFTDPETGNFSADFFGSFVQQVINPMVEAGQLDPASLTPAQIMQLAVSGQDSMGITGAVNSALTNNDRLPLGGIVTPNMVGPREDASFWGDIGLFNDRSDLGFREAMFGDKRVVQTPDGPITLPADRVGLRNQRQANIYGN